MDYRGKRTFDLIAAGSVLVATSPVLAVAALAVRRDSPGPVFFRDVRIGRDRQPFRLWKFRTMYVAEPGERRSAASITRTGHWLRRWSIDELPQLFNVVRGDMSLVGPRPLAQRQLVGLRPEHEARFDVKPGLTGLAQVNGRNAIPRVKRWDYDVEYATTASLRLDLAIVARTARVVLTGAGSAFPDARIQNQGLFDQ
jgi:lipopolysaccharide/colanic/teichoic acid biosynthesis glycosyltransferase